VDGPRGAANPGSETISRMAENERKLLSADELWERGIIHPQHTEEPAVQVFASCEPRSINRVRSKTPSFSLPR